ncbi:MAG: type II secretion system protein [candidate division WOR-3 bacterium]
MKRKAGFLLLEVLISALIIGGSIAASFYLFRMGLNYLKKAEESNFFSSKVPQAVSYLTNVAELEKGEGEAFLGGETELIWKSKLLESTRPEVPLPEYGYIRPYELFLYEVEFSLKKGNSQRDYIIKILRYKMLITPGVF